MAEQSGNVMLAIFAAIAAIGIVGATSVNIMQGPVRSMHSVTQKTIAENNMIAAGKLALMAAISQADGGDCDEDGTIEPIPFDTTGAGPKPTGGGKLPNTIGAAQLDPWGNKYGYCVWDHGSTIHAPSCGSNRLRGQADENGAVIAIISSGPDRIFQTQCKNAPDYVVRSSGSDDIVLAYSYAEAATMSGGLWNIKAGDPDTAEIAKDLEVRSSAGDVVFGVDTRSDVNRPSIRVDYITPLSRPHVEVLSPLRVGGDERSLYFGASQRLYGDDSSGLYFYSNNAASQIILRNNANANVGRLYANTARIGLQEPDGTWSYRADYGASTMFYVDGAIRMRLYPTYLNMQGNQIQNMAAPTGNNHATTKKYVDDKIASELSANPGIPSGAVMAFNLSTCPSGWTALSIARDRFIVGAGSSYALRATGGANSVALSVAQLPAHNHTGTAAAAGGHSHTVRTERSGASNHGHSGTNNFAAGLHIYSNNSIGYGTGTTDSVPAHTHSLTINNTGSGQAHENRPPYLALLYCEKN